MVSQKPSFEVGSSAVISLPKAVVDDNDLIDESALLDGDTSLSKRGDANSCGVDDGGIVAGKKRACKNCSCGLAEIEAAAEASGIDVAPVKLSLDEQVSKSSSCGGCYKGDAFRCASCPFLGKPAFEPGQERVVLQLDDDI